GSDFMPDHLSSFATALGGDWSHLLDGEYSTFAAVQMHLSPSTGLIPDFILHPAGSVAAAPGGFLEGANDGAYSYNSCRVPWRLAMGAITGGDTRSHDLTQNINTWIQSKTGGDPNQIMAGYQLNGNVISGIDYNDLAFTAPFGVGAMVDG